ncbi:hypothetical protein E5288_WYG009742 [Bos mutus]|uniref:Uncharacterized protein n=1 Tax=Bos mutus TaxID=72004 RepID=A0A6B0R0Q2_9CETA|nr:hypothetical protein [Bos mutus]
MRSGIASQAPESLQALITGVRDPRDTHLRRRGSRETAHGRAEGGSRAGFRAAKKEGPPLSTPTTLLSAHGPSTAWSNRHEPQMLLPVAQTLKADPPGSLPVPRVASVTPAHAGRRPGSEDARRRARAGRRLGGAEEGGRDRLVGGAYGGACAVLGSRLPCGQVRLRGGNQSNKYYRFQFLDVF